eukprot:GEZU01009530.1.p1 GENE.GEZU01009530.1~~GEZU01009530.1.p1  ORF type:complete len:120 (-),score=10.04 GEZU01009530.1:429-788(-)
MQVNSEAEYASKKIQKAFCDAERAQPGFSHSFFLNLITASQTCKSPSIRALSQDAGYDADGATHHHQREGSGSSTTTADSIGEDGDIQKLKNTTADYLMERWRAKCKDLTTNAPLPAWR